MMYNGKEQQDKAFDGSHFNWYDYGARFYDPTLGRFHTVDPLAEEFQHQSPFVYAANNPVRFIDFLGMNAQDPDEEKDKKHKEKKPDEEKDKKQEEKKPEHTYAVRVYYSAEEYQKAQDEKVQPQVGGGNSVLDYIGLLVGACDTYFSVMGEGFHNSLYWVQKNGIIRSTNILSNSNKIYKTSYDIVGNSLKGTKLIGKRFAVTGAVISTAQFIYDPSLANGIDGVMGLTTFVPGVGWVISGTYFLANTITEVSTGKTIGQHIDDNFIFIGTLIIYTGNRRK